MKFPVSFCLLLLLVCLSDIANAQTDLKLVPFSAGVTRAVDIAVGPDNRLYIVQQRGPVRIITQRGELLPDLFIDIRDQIDTTYGEQGMLGMAFHPDYNSNGFVFVSYTDTGGHSRIDRFTRSVSDQNQVNPASQQHIFFQTQPHQAHNGGDLAFGPDGYLYLALGDGGPMGNPNGFAQDRTTTLGKMIRIDVDSGLPYSVPGDNPFVGDPTTLDEIWAIGLRNPWRWSFDRVTGDLWISDVGEDLREEVNFEPAGSAGGANYGWGCFEGSLPFDTCSFPEPHALPIVEYPHDFLTGGISITGGFVYRGQANPDYYGKYIYCDFFSENFWTTTPDGTGGYTTTLLNTKASFISAFGEDIKGELYALKIDSGIVYKLKQECSSVVSPVGLDAFGINPVKASFYWDEIPGATNYRITGRALSGGPTRSRNLNANNTLTINGLVPGETYEWTITARCSDGSITQVSAPDTFMMPTLRNVQPSLLNIYPVPADHEMILNWSASLEGTVSLIDLNGKVLIQQVISGSALHLSVKNIPSGIYLVQTQTANGSDTQLVTVQH